MANCGLLLDVVTGLPRPRRTPPNLGRRVVGEPTSPGLVLDSCAIMWCRCDGVGGDAIGIATSGCGGCSCSAVLDRDRRLGSDDEDGDGMPNDADASGAALDVTLLRALLVLRRCESSSSSSEAIGSDTLKLTRSDDDEPAEGVVVAAVLPDAGGWASRSSSGSGSMWSGTLSIPTSSSWNSGDCISSTLMRLSATVRRFCSCSGVIWSIGGIASSSSSQRISHLRMLGAW